MTIVDDAAALDAEVRPPDYVFDGAPTSSDQAEDPPPPRRWPVIVAVAVAALWTTFCGYAMAVGGPPDTITQWPAVIAQWAVPVVGIVAVLALVQRMAPSEARRFGHIARDLSTETDRLEQRLLTVNRELSLAREFLSAQGRELEFLGRTASERLTEHATRLEAAMDDSARNADAIGAVTATALDNMERLRADLPVITNAARDMTNQIGATGRIATDQFSQMTAGLDRLADAGASTERQLVTLAARIDETSDALTTRTELLAGVAEERFARLSADIASFGADVERTEESALAGLAGRIASLRLETASLGEDIAQRETDALQDAEERADRLRAEMSNWDDVLAGRLASFTQGVEDRNRAIAAASMQMTASLNERLLDIDRLMAEHSEAQSASLARLAAQGDGVAAQADALAQKLAKAAAHGEQARLQMDDSVAVLTERLTASRAELAQTEAALAARTEDSLRLLELVQAVVRHGQDALPTALRSTEDGLERLGDRSRDVEATLTSASERGAGILESIEAAQKRAAAVSSELETMQCDADSAIETRIGALASFREELANLAAQTGEQASRLDALASDSAARLAKIAAHGAQTIVETGETGAAELAERLRAASRDAVAEAVEAASEAGLKRIDIAREATVAAAQTSAQLLRDQLAKLLELTANLEQRIAHARAQAQDDVDADFTRRIAVLIESLNSNAIDIDKVLSEDVPDTAWASYLRGDRGIFTRRAVRLVNNREARALAELYDEDEEFRAHVNRYIHDFEAMLRKVLSTRDGHAVSVTLLSSDNGKLYVALAQALERLRD